MSLKKIQMLSSKLLMDYKSHWKFLKVEKSAYFKKKKILVFFIIY